MALWERDCTFIYFGKKNLPTQLLETYFQIFFTIFYFAALCTKTCIFQAFNSWICQHYCFYMYARHYNPLLIRNRSWILTIHEARIFRRIPLEKTFLTLKSIQTAGYNGVRMVSKMKNKFTYMIIRFLEKILPTRLLEPTRLLISEKKTSE